MTWMVYKSHWIPSKSNDGWKPFVYSSALRPGGVVGTRRHDPVGNWWKKWKLLFYAQITVLASIYSLNTPGMVMLSSQNSSYYFLATHTQH